MQNDFNISKLNMRGVQSPCQGGAWHAFEIGLGVAGLSVDVDNLLGVVECTGSSGI